MTSTELTEDDVGKQIVSSEGIDLGLITEVRDGTPYVDTHSGVVDKIKATFDWGEKDEDAFPLKTAEVAEVRDDEVILQ